MIINLQVGYANTQHPFTTAKPKNPNHYTSNNVPNDKQPIQQGMMGMSSKGMSSNARARDVTHLEPSIFFFSIPFFNSINNYLLTGRLCVLPTPSAQFVAQIHQQTQMKRRAQTTNHCLCGRTAGCKGAWDAIHLVTEPRGGFVFVFVLLRLCTCMMAHMTMPSLLHPFSTKNIYFFYMLVVWFSSASSFCTCSNLAHIFSCFSYILNGLNITFFSPWTHLCFLLRFWLPCQRQNQVRKGWKV